MKRTDFADMFCPIARGLGRVGEWWSILILREAMYGVTRFDEFEKNLKIAPNMLARRLSDLVSAGLLERRQYCARPPRYEYVLTEAGAAFQPVLLTFVKWGNDYFSPDGPSLLLVDRTSGQPVSPVLVDEHTGSPLTPDNVRFVAGPGASDGMTRHLGEAARRTDALRDASVGDIEAGR
jgi:DNA-binding HxlR family transcriptional regulator